MKKMTMMFLLATMCVAVHAQKVKTDDVPAVVKEAFAKRFPNIQHVKWSKEDDNSFEAEFKMNDKEQSATFDATGVWLETETEINRSSLPQAVTAALAKEYEGYAIEEAEWTETSNNAYYEVEVEKGEQTFEIQIDKTGKILKQEEEHEHGHKRHDEDHGDHHHHGHHKSKKD